MRELKIAVIADHDMVARFTLDALDELRGCDSVTVYSCTNTRLKRNALKHGAYYALNLLTIRNPMTRTVPIAQSRKRIDEVISFESGYEGAWQTLPDHVIDDIAARGFDIVLKFGMGLMRIPPPERLAVPILSYHHGDPDLYRGRPAGFWETVEGTPAMGQIVQILSNKLDAGRVVAFAETKVFSHSYRATLLEAFRHSPLLINEAVRNALAGVHLDKASKGRNYRLPSNLTVAGMVLRMAGAWLHRIFYGAVMEKKWRVSLAPADPGGAALDGAPDAFPPKEKWRTLPVARDYVFYADPFFSAEPEGILVEALSRRTGLGELLLIGGDGKEKRISTERGHHSYPFTFHEGGRQLLLPEIASWSEPQIFTIGEDGMQPAGRLRLEQPDRIVDPTLLRHEGRFYLFGNRATVGSNALYLWSSDALDAPFRLHPLSPIRVTPRGARMAGSLVRSGGRLLRFGQDFLSGYGNGIFIFEVEELSADRFRERQIGAIRFERHQGPHTLNWKDGELLFDWYDDRFAPLAGLRRLNARLSRRGSPD